MNYLRNYYYDAANTFAVAIVVGIFVQALSIWWGVRIARRKGRDPMLGFLLPFFLGLIGILILFIIEDKSADKEKIIVVDESSGKAKS